MADVKQITLPSGTTYMLKDQKARDDIAAIEQQIAGGVSFIIAWDGVSEPTVALIPKGIKVTYNSTEYTGTLETTDATAGGFYLVKDSSTTFDTYAEYTVIKPDTSDDSTWFWEKIGDTKADLSGLVTDVTLNKQTKSFIGSNATFTITQPTIALATGATAGTGVISVATGITSASASGDNVNAVTGYANPSTDTFLKGVKVTTQPAVTLTANAATATGRITYVESVGAATTTKLSASASGGAVSASGDNVTALTGLGSPSTKSAIGSNATFTITQPTVSLGTNSSSGTGKVQVGIGTGTASTTNTDWLKSISVSNETLTIGAATLDTTYLGATASGANTAWNSKDAVTAVTGYASPTTDTVIGTASTFSVTNPTVTITSGSTGDVTVATDGGAATTKYMSASASGTAVGANGTGSAITALGTPTTDEVLGSSSTITVTPTTTNIKATASGANTAWNSKDSGTGLTNATDVNVTKNQ